MDLSHGSAYPPGYKQTEVGVIPKDWEVVTIGEIASFSSGNGIRVAALTEQSSDTPVPVYGGNGIAGYTAVSLVQQPVVIIGRVGQKCGEVYLTHGPAWVTDNALYPRSVYRRLDVRFFASVLQAAGLNNVKNRNDLPLITQSILHSVRISLPPTLAEQQAIAEALSDVDVLTEAQEQLIAKKRLIKQGAVQALLQPKKTWVPTKLGNLGSFLKGSGVRKDEALSGELPCVRYGELYTRHDNYIREFHSWISPAIAAKARRLRTGDILFAGSGETKEEIGKSVAFVDVIEAYAGGDVVILRQSIANSMFLGYYLNTPAIGAQKASKGQGDAIVHISSAALADIDLLLPPIDEQTAIAAVLSDMDAEIAALEDKLAKTRLIKQGMMQELLTGKTRLL